MSRLVGQHSSDVFSFQIPRYAYDVNGNPEYIGYALPGAAEGALRWRIKKLTWDVNGRCTGAGFPNADTSYKYSWTDRTTYSYS